MRLLGAHGVSPTPLHAGVDAGAAAVGLLVALDPIAAPIDVLTDGGSDAALLLAGTAVLAGAVYAFFTRPIGIRSAS